MESNDLLKCLEKLLNKWKYKNPFYWSKIDSFCWLYDWSQRKNIEFTDLENLYNHLPRGSELCNLKFEFFINLSENHGMNIFEDLQILISSFYSRSPRKYKSKKKKKIQQNIEQKKRNGPKIWEFLRNLLLDNTTNPDIIKWLDLSNESFYLVKPDKIAELWGRINQNNNMTFEKLGRSIRYCYKKNQLVHLKDNFTYKFGPRSFK